MKKLCICVDDFGLHEGINQAVIELAQAGRVQATSCMTAGAAWAQGARQLIELRGKGILIQAGLHLDFTENLPQQWRFPLGRLIAMSYARLLPAKQILAEIQKQLDAFEAAMNCAPDFVDGHQHVHQLPQIREALLGELNKRYGAKKPWLRNTQRSQGLTSSSDLSQVKPFVIEALGASELQRQANRLGFLQNAGFLGVYDFTGGAQRYRALLSAWLQAAQEDDLLMCHPSALAIPGDAISAARLVEYEIFHSVELHPA